MIIDLRCLPPKGQLFEGEDPASVLELDGEPSIRLSAPLKYSVSALMIGKELVVSGRLSMIVGFQCSLCGEPFDFLVSEPSFVADIEVDDPYACVDLTSEMRESILLAFPTYPRCRPDCKGLCPFCGANLNEGSCNCRRRNASGWDALEGLSFR